MNSLEETMKAAAGGGAERVKAVTPEDYAKVVENHQPIEGLKVGDVLVLKEGKKTTIAPQYGERIVVHALNPGEEVTRDQVHRQDFTALFIDSADGEILEYRLDSRNYKRAE